MPCSLAVALRTAVPATLAIAASACQPTAHKLGPVAPAGTIVTQEKILASGANTAWEAIKRTVPFLSLREKSGGEPARMWRRGRGSIYLDEAPVIILDGTRLADFRSLHLIPAHTILVMYILTGIEGTTYYGTNAVGGVIEIRTKSGPETPQS